MNQKLMDAEHLSIECQITLQELHRAVKNMAINKMQGCDGLSVEIYQCLWDELGSVLHAAVLYAYEKCELHLSARRGVISLIQKKGKDGMYIKNWRPLTLLNTDYKNLAKAIAYRIKPFLSKLIHVSQTGFMHGHNIAHNIRKLTDII